MDLGFDITPLNIGALNSQISSAGAGGGGEGGNRIKMDLHTVISFFLLPPWCAAKGQLAKEIWECYDLPARQGQKWSRHVAWCTYESLEPGITSRDPVVNVLREMASVGGAKSVEKMMPSKSFHINVMVRGVSALNKDGSVTPDSYVENNPPTVGILRLTPRTFAVLARVVVSMSSHLPYHYLSAVPFSLSKSITVQKGGREMTSYTLLPEGRQTAKGMVPDMVNLVEEYGESFVKDAYTRKVADLDMMYPLPTESKRVEADMWASEIRRVLSSKLRTAPEGVGTKVSAPEVPASGGGSSAPVAEQAPKAAIPLPSPADVKSRDLGLADAPRSGGLPVCLGRHSVVSTTPNKAWCVTCTFARACKIKEAAAGATVAK
jgi:hypothetical protein